MDKPTRHDLYKLSLWRRLTGRFRTLPDFIILGAQKAGTTTIYDNLVKHPAVKPCDIKEAHFFDTNWFRGENWYRAHFDYQKNKTVTSPWITGEGSPYYLFHPLVPDRIKQICPESRLIIILRNPVDRAYSHYQHEKRKGREPLEFAEALDQENARLAGEAEKLLADPSYNSFAHQHYSYQARGRYAEQLEQWFTRFPQEQFLILESGALNRDFAASMEKLYQFLDLPSHALPQPKRSNVGSYDKMPPDVKERLEQYFAPHNQRLYELIKQDFNW